jgi:hypothetical protein
MFDSLSSSFSDSTSLQVDALNNVISTQNNTASNIVWKLEELNANQNSNFNSLLTSQDNFFNTMDGLVNFNTPSVEPNIINTNMPTDTINELGLDNNSFANTFEYKIDSLIASNTELNTTLSDNQTELLDFLSTSYENNSLQNNAIIPTDQNSFYSVIDTLTTEHDAVFDEATTQFTDVFSTQNEAMETVKKDLSTTFSTTNTNLSGTFTMHEQTFTQISEAFLAKLSSISANGQGGFASGMGSMFGMSPQQYSGVSSGLEDMFNQQPDIFGSGAGLSGQLDNLFASQPDIFGSTTPGYVSAFSSPAPTFGLGGLGTAFGSPFGTMPTAPTESLFSGDIMGGSNPLAMSGGSMMNMMGGMGGMFGPTSALTQGISSMGQSLSSMAMPQMQMGTGMGMSTMTQTPQMQMGGMGGLMGGMGMSSMFMSMIPMLMGGLGGGSPAGQAAKERAGGTGTQSGDTALGGSEEGSDKIDELKDETEEFKELSEKLLTEIKDNVLEIKINHIEFQIETMEKMDKQFQAWLAIFMITHMQKIMLFAMMLGQLQALVTMGMIQTQLLSQIAGCTCGMGGGGMAKGGIVQGLVRGYAKGAITTGPELAMIGEGRNREAIVPLPDNRSIPVTITNKDDSENNSDNDKPINIIINGVEGTEKGLRKSAAQIAYYVNRATRNSVSRY